MDFLALAKSRQSCRGYIGGKEIEHNVLKRILKAGCLAPSACNSQPYHFTLCTGTSAQRVLECTRSMGMNSFTKDCPAVIVISEDSYNKTAALGSRVKHNDFRSIDIGIAAAYITAQAESEGVASCIIGWFDKEKLAKLCGAKGEVRLCIALGYAKDPAVRAKKRRPYEETVTEIK